jgi:hypothetical protein
MPLQKSIAIAGIRFEALPVEHSIRAPAVGYRVSANLSGPSMFPTRPDSATGAARCAA